MADNNLVPITFRGFKGAVDAEFIDVEDAPIDLAAALVNVTPFSKVGSLGLADGHTVHMAPADLPIPPYNSLTGYILTNFFTFTIDKDNKDVTIVIYTNTTTKDVRMFMTPWYNPKAQVSNYNSLVTEASWISGGTYKWLELTERYEITLLSLTSDFIVDFNTSFPTTADFYLNNYFIVNTNLSRKNRYNYITSWDKTTKKATLITRIRFAVPSTDDWGGATGVEADTLIIVKFPVRYLYHIDPNTLIDTYGTTAPYMVANPTQFIYRENALRIPCGKTAEPLIVSYTENKNFFMGSNEMSYEGWWFDFQSPPQQLRKSAVSAFGAAFSPTGTTNIAYLEKSGSNWVWLSAPSGGVGIASVKFDYRGGGGISKTVKIKPYTPVSGGYNNPPGSCNGYWGIVNGNWQWIENCAYLAPNWYYITNNVYLHNPANSNFIEIYVKIGATITAADIAVANFYSLQTGFTITVQTAGTFALPVAGASLNQIFIYGNAAIGYEFSGNTHVENIFLGLQLDVTPLVVGVDWQGADRYKFIIMAIVDNRSQALFAHGLFRPKTGDGSSAVGSGMTLRITPWFSRRLTGFNCFNQKHDDIPAIGGVTPTSFPSMGRETSIYPFFQYVNGKVNAVYVKINEIKRFDSYSIYDFQKVSEKGAAPFRMNIALLDTATGKNAYTLDTDTVGWYVKINDDCGWDGDGEGTSFIATVNRFIDQDNSLCYTRGTFIGGINGKFFVTGVGNLKEGTPYRTDDYIHWNLYALATSEYDTFRRDKKLPVAVGDKDRIITVENHKGYLNIIKKTNFYAMDVSQREIEYNVIDTQLGRGSEFADAVIQTPHGIILPAYDAPWLITPDGMQKLMDESNGNLRTYIDYFVNQSGSRTISTVYKPKRDELLLISSSIPEASARILVYSFIYKYWYTMMYANSNPVRPQTSVNNEVLFLSGTQIVKLDSTSFVYIKDDATSQNVSFEMSTQQIAMADRLMDFIPQWFTMYFDIKSNTTSEITVYIDVDYSGTFAVAINFTVPSTSDVLIKGRAVELPFERIPVLSSCAFKITASSAKIFNLNSFHIWITKQARKMGSYPTLT